MHEILQTYSIVNIVKSNGNKYLFNNNTSYVPHKKFILNCGTYTLKNIPETHPMAILNVNCKCIEYSGDSDKKISKTVNGTDADGLYDFYHGDITINVIDNFEEISIFCCYHGYMGGEKIFTFYTNKYKF